MPATDWTLWKTHRSILWISCRHILSCKTVWGPVLFNLFDSSHFEFVPVNYNLIPRVSVLFSAVCCTLVLNSGIACYQPIHSILLLGLPSKTNMLNSDILLTVHLSIFISVINQLDIQNFCFTITLFHASTCFKHMCSSSGGQNCITQPLVPSHMCDDTRGCVMQFWPPDD